MVTRRKKYRSNKGVGMNPYANPYNSRLRERVQAMNEKKGSRNEVNTAGGGEGESGPPKGGGTGKPMSAKGLAVAKGIARGLLGPVLGQAVAYGMEKTNQRAHVNAHAASVGRGGYGAGSGDSPGAVAGHDSSDNDSAGQGGSDPSADGADNGNF